MSPVRETLLSPPHSVRFLYNGTQRVTFYVLWIIDKSHRTCTPCKIIHVYKYFSNIFIQLRQFRTPPLNSYSFVIL